MEAKPQTPGSTSQNRRRRDAIAQHLGNLPRDRNTLPVRGI
jgi:hypothetical protein